jgi:hypothetical protein
MLNNVTLYKNSQSVKWTPFRALVLLPALIVLQSCDLPPARQATPLVQRQRYDHSSY